MGYFKNYSHLNKEGSSNGISRLSERIQAEQERKELDDLSITEETRQMVADLDAFLQQVQRELDGRRFAIEGDNLILPDEKVAAASTKELGDLVHSAYLTIIEAVVTNIIKNPQYEYKDGIYDILNLPVKNAELEDMMAFLSVINKDRPSVVSKYYGNIAGTCWSIGDLAGFVNRVFISE